MNNCQNHSDPLWIEARKRTGFKVHFTVYLLVNLFLWTLWLLNVEGKSEYWPAFTTIGWGIGVFFHFVHTYMKPSFFNIEKEYKKLKQKNNI